MPEVKSRREQYSDATRAALLETATSTFAEKGYAGTALADVAATAQVTRGAVYHHFENKQALFRDVFERLEEDVARTAHEAYAAAPTPLQGAFAALNDFLDRSCEPVYSEVVWRQAPIALGWEELIRCEERYALALIEEILNALTQADLTASLPTATTTRIVFSMLGGAGMALADADQADKARVKAECLDVMGRFVAGLLSDGG